MTPRGILPFYFAVEPSPTESRTAFAIARPAVKGEESGVSVIVEDQHECSEIFRFSRLGLVRIAWSKCGQSMAFVQRSTLFLSQPNQSLDLYEFDRSVSFLAFDRARRLWCLAGRRLTAINHHDSNTTIDDVDCAAVSEGTVFCRVEGSVLRICSHNGHSERIVATHPVGPHFDSVALSIHGRYIVAAVKSVTIEDRARLQVVRLNQFTGTVRSLFDGDVAIGFNSNPRIKVIQLNSGGVLAGYEKESCAHVWNLAPGRPPQRVSPARFEVFDFSVDVDYRQLAVVASDISSSPGSCERQLLIGRRFGDTWRFGARLTGVYEMPRWRNDGRLEVLCGNDGRWTRQVVTPQRTDQPQARRWRSRLCVVDRSVEYDRFTLPGPRNRNAAIILLPRLHQQFVAGAQSFYFHNCIFSIAHELSTSGYTVVSLSGPGAIGRGRRRREPLQSGGSYLGQLRMAACDLAESLRQEGRRGIGVLGGSLAGVPALRLLGQGTPFSGCVLIAPLFEATIPVTSPCRHYLRDDPVVDSLEDAAGALAAPLLVIQGDRDEVVPESQGIRLRERVPNKALIAFCVLQNEGHIFAGTQAWRHILLQTQEFFSECLADEA